MKAGDIVLAAVIQADRQIKKRPLLLLRAYPPFDDFVACGISSQLQRFVPSLDEIIDDRDSDFQSTGLKVSSLVRSAYVASVPSAPSLGRIGWLPLARVDRILSKLSNFLRSQPQI